MEFKVNFSSKNHSHYHRFCGMKRINLCIMKNGYKRNGWIFIYIHKYAFITSTHLHSSIINIPKKKWSKKVTNSTQSFCQEPLLVCR